MGSTRGTYLDCGTLSSSLIPRVYHNPSWTWPSVSEEVKQENKTTGVCSRNLVCRTGCPGEGRDEELHRALQGNPKVSSSRKLASPLRQRHR